MVCHHYCNNELRCPECIRRFWKWAEMHTNGRKPKAGEQPRISFYEAAAFKTGGRVYPIDAADDGASLSPRRPRAPG